MWRRLKSLWGGRSSFEPPDGIGVSESTPAEQPELPAVDTELARDLDAVDAALGAGKVGQALGRVRALLLEEPGSAQVLERGAAVLHRAGEEELAKLFERAADSADCAAHIDLASGFLEMADPAMAAAMARGALARAGPDDPRAAPMLAEALARFGDHEGVVGVLAHFKGRWPGQGVLERYALSAVLLEDLERFAEVERELAASQSGRWIALAADRVQAYPRASLPPSEPALRHCHFVEYGTVLLGADDVLDGIPVGPALLDQALRRAAAVLAGSSATFDKLVYASQRGEVLARWLGDLLDVNAIPLSSRIPRQPVLAVIVDDDDLQDAFEQPGFDSPDTLVFQLVKDPEQVGAPVADVLGWLAQAAELPFDAVVTGRAAERVPPRLMVAELRKAAVGPEPADLSELAEWARKRSRALTLNHPSPLGARPPYLSDTPGWALRSGR